MERSCYPYILLLITCLTFSHVILGQKGSLDLIKINKWKGGASTCINLSFDDNLESHKAISEILDQYGFKGTFFVISSSMLIDSIKDISSRGHEIGSHTFSHYRLNDTDSIQDDFELRKSKEMIDNVIDTKCVSFAEPYHARSDLGSRIAFNNYLFIRNHSIYEDYSHLDITSDLTLNDVVSYIESRIQNGSMLHLAGHGIDRDGYYPISRSLFVQILNSIQGYSDSGELWVATIRDGQQYDNLYHEISLNKELHGDTLKLSFVNYNKEKYKDLEASPVSIEIPYTISNDLSSLTDSVNIKARSDKYIITTDLKRDTSLVLVLNDYLLRNTPVAKAGADQYVEEGYTVTLDGSESYDPNNDSLAFQWTAPEGIVLNSVTAAKPTFTAPGVTKDTTYVFALIVNDRSLDSRADSVSITVKPKIHIQKIMLISGWNIISSNVVPSNTNMKNIVQPLIDDRKLIKVMDESGRVIEDFGAFGGWKNGIGDFNQTKGYKVNMTEDDTLTLEGSDVQLPLSIILSAGWNLISYPCVNEQDAMTMVQPLIDSGKINKVMDESGKAIENFGAFGGWKNNIGNFTAGKGYKVNMMDSGTLILRNSELRAASVASKTLPSTYFTKVCKGNGTDHMNINLVDLGSSKLQTNDEIGIFDGEVCVGSATICSDQMVDGSISISTSCSDGQKGSINGFIPGDTVAIKLYREGSTYNLIIEKLWGSETFEKSGSLFAKVRLRLPIEMPVIHDSIQIICHPNPFSGEIYIDVRNSISTNLIVEIYNVFGQKINRLYEGLNTGCLNLKWDGTDEKGNHVVSGIYLCKVNNLSKKIVLIGNK